jgi:hypothetical protein
MNRFFVYCHVRPDTNAVFYVGKGIKRRITDGSRRSNHWKNIVKKAGGFRPIVIRENIEERDALDLEVQIIAALRSIGCRLCNMNDGGDGVSGYRHPPETVARIRQNAIGNKSRTGQKASEEERKKVSLAQIGKKHSEQTKKRMGIQVRCLTNGVVYDTQTEASNALNLNSSSVSMCCRGLLKQTKGYQFQYADGPNARRPYSRITS